VSVSGKRFRIAFSYAGEKRDFVSQVADILAKHFGEDKILYDKFHEAEFANWKLGLNLQELYHDQSDLIVVVVCPDYIQKDWTGLEWVAIHGMLMSGKDREIMLCRFEHAQLQGLHANAGFVELDHKAPAQAADLILERLALNERLPKEHYKSESNAGSERRRTSIPNNLPRLQYFFGREADLKKIGDALASDARGWGALIDGPGGIGKTSLAIRAAELVPQGRFRRIIFLSSKERELTADGQRSLGSFVLPGYLKMLNAIARELDKPNLAKTAEAERSDAILRTLRDAGVLLVLDNLETLPEGDRDQLFALLNRLPRGCSAIVTSRQRADASAVAVRLDKLDWPAARNLIAELAKDNDRLRQASEAEQRALYDQTGGNPLLIRWVAGQLGLGRCRNIAAALDFLSSAPVGNNPLEFIFGDLLDTFTANETRVLAALSHFTIAMEVKVIAELADLNEAAAQGALSDLSRRALMVPDPEERCFALVPMVADFLRRSRPEFVSETAARLEERTYALIVENGYKKYDRFPVLDAAWPSVAAALPLFIAGPNPRLQTVCAALQLFVEFTGRWDEALFLNQQAEAKAVAIGDHDQAGWRTYQVGWMHYLRQQADEVLACADRAAAHWRAALPGYRAAAHSRLAQPGDRERAKAMRLRGLGEELKADYPAAIATYREVLSLHSKLSPVSEDMASALNSLAAAKQRAGDLSAAEGDYREALRVARAVGDAEGVAIYTGNLAALALDRKDWPGAEVLSREALTLSERVGRQELIGIDCRSLSKALMRQGKRTEALRYAHRAVDIFTQLASPDLEYARAILRECES
jgi:tetratricopeptide (TPR) repeat protein